MILSTLTPYELGETKSKEALEYLAVFLTKGSDNDKRLAASAIKKLVEEGINCDSTIPFLIQNLDSKKPQLRQYTLKTLSLMKIDENFKDHLYKIYVKEDKPYNLALLKNIVEKFDTYNEIELINHSVLQNINSQLKAEKEDKKGYVYFLQESFSNTIKIGKTKSLKDRMNNFGVKLPFDVQVIHCIETNNALYTEKLFHLHFEKKRVNGEWFQLSEDEIFWIKQGSYTRKINLSIGANPPSQETKENMITSKQLDYLIQLLQKHNYPINFPLGTLTSKQASELIQMIKTDKENVVAN